LHVVPEAPSTGVSWRLVEAPAELAVRTGYTQLLQVVGTDNVRAIGFGKNFEFRPRAAPAHCWADLGLTSVFGGTSLKALRFGSHPGTTLPPLAAIVERPHSLGDLQ
jgi:hypothetical protein